MCSTTFWQDFGTILLRSQKAYIWLRWDPWRPNLRSHLEPQKYYTKLVTDPFLSPNVKIHPVSLSAFKLSAPSHCGYKCHVQTMLKDPLLLTFKIHCFWHLHCRTMKWIFFDNVCKHASFIQVPYCCYLSTTKWQQRNWNVILFNFPQFSCLPCASANSK